MASWRGFQDNVSAFGQRSEDIVVSFIDDVNRKPPPPLLYHYTDHRGLRGIIESGTLRLTDLFCLNDPGELQHGIDYALEILRRRIKRDRLEVRIFRDKFVATFLRDLRESAEFFVGCLSSTGDNLDQWRAYADNGRGYALGFDGPKLVSNFDSGASGRSSFPIVYGPRRLRGLYSQIIDLLLPFISAPRGGNLNNDDIDDYMAELSATLAMNLITLSMLVKHRAYKHEHEYRLLQMFTHGSTIDGLQYRPKGKVLVRYIHSDWKASSPELLRSIVIGPAADPYTARRFATDCCDAFLSDPDKVDIWQSKLPYRA